MVISVRCDSCNAAFRTKDEHAGKRGRCPKCGELVDIPQPSAATPPPLPVERPAIRPSREPSQQDEEPASPRKNTSPKAIGLALLCAIAGAGIWATLVWKTGYEFGWIAWGIGLLVTGPAYAVGGRGEAMGVICAAMALVSIFGGKLIGTMIAIEAGLEEISASTVSEDVFEEYRRDAFRFAKLGKQPDDDLMRAFIAKHHYSMSESAEGVTEEELESFLTWSAPFLSSFEQDYPSYEAWLVDAEPADISDLREQFSVIEVMQADFVPYDFLWCFLAVSTAYGIMVNRGRSRRPRSRRRRR